MYITNCGQTANDVQSDTNTFLVTGNDEFVNPYGQLPGDMVGELILLFIVFVFYLILGIIWSVFLVKYRKDLMKLQLWISFAILLGFLENVITAADYANYNNTGTISIGFNIIEALLISSKRTVSFVGLTLVAMGYTVSISTLEKKKKIALIVVGVLYFGISICYEFISAVRATPSTQYLNTSAAAEYTFLIFTTIMDFVFLFWIFF